MASEAELAQLLIRMGTERGADIENILAEMTNAEFPWFVDTYAVRTSLLDAVESSWRADLEDRISQLRQQFDQESAREPRPAATEPQQEVAAQTVPVVDPDSETIVDTTQPPEPPSDATIQEIDAEAATEQDPSDALPNDATMIWNTRGG